MKILSLSLDKNIFNENKSVFSRTLEYSKFLDLLTVLVPINHQNNITDINLSVFGSGGGNKLVQFIRLFILGIKILAKNKYDLITVQDPYYLGLLGLILAKIYKLPLEIQVHGFEKEGRIRNVLAFVVLNFSSGIRTVSERLKSELISDFKLSADKISVIQIFSQFVSIPRPNKDYKSHQPFIFLTVGRLVPVKNISLQIRALAELVRDCPAVRLVIVGDGPEKQNLVELANSLSLSGYVLFIGEVEDVASFYEKADVFLLTSNREGWGLVVVEAASFGLPIIMTDVGCAGELIKNEESGLVVPINDKDNLVRAIKKLCQDQILREKIGLGSKSVISMLPDWEETKKTYKNNWFSLMSKK